VPLCICRIIPSSWDFPSHPPEAPMSLPAFGPVSVICDTLGVSKGTAHNLLRSGEIASIKVNSCRRVDLASLSAYIERLRAESAA
jgi:excisionase family DNA binding protein